jgi:hypothetical protein
MRINIDLVNESSRFQAFDANLLSEPAVLRI